MKLQNHAIIVTGGASGIGRQLGAKGTCVNTASIYGTTAALGSFNYNAAKAAVIMMTRSAALELAPHGICVVAVAPRRRREAARSQPRDHRCFEDQAVDGPGQEQLPAPDEGAEVAA